MADENTRLRRFLQIEITIGLLLSILLIVLNLLQLILLVK